MSEISPSAYGENDPILRERLSKCQSLPEITEVMRQRALELGATKDSINPEVFHYEHMQRPDEATGGTFSREIMIHGAPKVVVSDSELGLERAIGKAYQEATAADSGTQPRGADGKFTSRRELNLAEKTELDLRFRRGEISAPDYLRESGELERSFNIFAKEKLGVDPDELATNQQTQDAWRAATEQWLKSPEGETWQGGGDGDENLRRIILLIEANGLQDSPSVETLNRVVNFARQNGLLVPRAGTTKDAIASANSAEEISAAARASLGLRPRNSNLWGR